MITRRVVAEMLTAGVIGMTGDVAVQLLTAKESQEPLSPERTGRLCVFRVLQAPIVSASWRVFDRWVVWKGAAGVAAKIALDQGLLMPPSMAVFYVSQGLMEGLSFDLAIARMRANFLGTVMLCLPYWVTMHCVTFSVIPTRYRIGWVSIAAVGWNMCISQLNASARRSEV